MLETTTTRPNDATSDDYDLYHAICTTVQQCELIKTTFWHIKGHQDRNPTHPLTRIKQLNVECDAKAKQYTTTTTCSSTAMDNPRIPEAQPHLCINRKIICRNVLPNIQWAVSTLAYRKEMQGKYHWTASDVENIHRAILQATLKPLKPDDQRRVILFINEKLPLCASKAHLHHGSLLCPSCQREPETAQHYLACRHPDRTKLFNALKTTLTNTTQKYRLHPCIFTTICLASSLFEMKHHSQRFSTMTSNPN